MTDPIPIPFPGRPPFATPPAAAHRLLLWAAHELAVAALAIVHDGFTDRVTAGLMPPDARRQWDGAVRALAQAAEHLDRLAQALAPGAAGGDAEPTGGAPDGR